MMWLDRPMREASGEIADWEGTAAEISSATGCDEPPVDAFELADACDLRIEPAAIPAAQVDLRKRLIRLNVGMRPERQHMSVAHEIGHFALDRGGLANGCDGARYIGGALMLPRAHFDRDLARTAWSITKLRERHINASATAIAVRITQLRDAVATIIDPRGRKKPWRVASPWIAEPRIARISSWERDLARRAYDLGAELRGDELCYAVPLLEDREEHRVIVVCEIEQLALRL